MGPEWLPLREAAVREEGGGWQLLLTLPLQPVFTFANLVVGEGNRVAVGLARALTEPAAPMSLVVVGEAGSGKSHLLQAVVSETRAQAGPGAAVYLEASALERGLVGSGDDLEQALAALLTRHADCRLVAIDGLEWLPERPLLQEAALYLYNEMRGRGGRWLGGSRSLPAELPLREDLRSRLLWGAVVTLAPPDEATMAAIVHKLALDRQLHLAGEVVNFLLLRLPRRVADLAAALDALDQASLRQKRPITIPLAKEVLGV